MWILLCIGSINFLHQCLQFVYFNSKNHIFSARCMSDSHFDTMWREEHLTASDSVFERETFFKEKSQCAYVFSKKGRGSRNESSKEFEPISDSMRFCLYVKKSNALKIPNSYDNQNRHPKYHVIETKDEAGGDEMD